MACTVCIWGVHASTYICVVCLCMSCVRGRHALCNLSIYICIRGCVYTCVYTCIYIYVCIWQWACTCVYVMCILMHMVGCTCIVCVCVCMRVCAEANLECYFISMKPSSINSKEFLVYINVFFAGSEIITGLTLKYQQKNRSSSHMQSYINKF